MTMADPMMAERYPPTQLVAVRFAASATEHRAGPGMETRSGM